MFRMCSIQLMQLLVSPTLVPKYPDLFLIIWQTLMITFLRYALQVWNKISAGQTISPAWSILFFSSKYFRADIFFFVSQIIKWYSKKYWLSVILGKTNSISNGSFVLLFLLREFSPSTTWKLWKFSQLIKHRL